MKIKETLSGFKQFILRGNVVDLAVGVLVGGAFGSLVTALVKDLFTPLIAAIFKQPDFSNLIFTIHGSQFLYGDFINGVISFLIIAFTIYFLIVLPVNTLISHSRKAPPQDPTTKKCPFCRSEIVIDATRCAYCTQEIPLHPTGDNAPQSSSK
jgi:large conductance mechanosensitive channel